jgi:hypothetical protein
MMIRKVMIRLRSPKNLRTNRKRKKMQTKIQKRRRQKRKRRKKKRRKKKIWMHKLQKRLNMLRKLRMVR